VALLLAVQPQEWCVYSYSSQPDSCTMVRLGGLARVGLFGLTLAGLAAGSWAVWESLQRRGGNSHSAW
jgi:hypothetical protein